MYFRVIIPARYDSKRLPGKVLLNIDGKPMLQHVYERAVASGAESVVIATDDERIATAAEKFGAAVCMTAADHQSGTERLSEAVVALEYDPDEIVVCVEADQPLLPAEYLRLVAEDLEEHDNVKVTSICDAIEDWAELVDPHNVKVVMNRRNYAMYFTRATVPWELDNFKGQKNIKLSDHHYRHIGLYAYRVSFLADYMEWAACPLERLESLEQLRILWNGGRIHLRISPKKLPPSIDVEEDLEKVRGLFKK